MSVSAIEKSDCDIDPSLPVYVIVPAAGQGTRMGEQQNKPFIDLQGTPVIIRTLRTLAACSCICGIVVVARADEIPDMQVLFAEWRIHRLIDVIPGGATRQESVFAGLRAVAEHVALHPEIDKNHQPADPLIAIHDGARCLVSQPVICRALRHAAETAPCAAAIPVKDTIKMADSNGHVQTTLDRSVLFAIQTPQAARLSTLLNAFAAAQKSGFTATDDLSVLEAAGVPVDLVAGDETNIKLTTPYDLMIARALLESGRIQVNGNDSHAACRVL